MDNNSSGNNNSNGFSSKDLLNQIWNKIESIESKLDTKLGELDRRIIVLELETIKRDGPLERKIKDLVERVNTIESNKEAQDHTDEVLSKQKDELFNKRNIVLSLFATVALISNVIIALVTVYNG